MNCIFYGVAKSGKQLSDFHFHLHGSAKDRYQTEVYPEEEREWGSTACRERLRLGASALKSVGKFSQTHHLALDSRLKLGYLGPTKKIRPRPTHTGLPTQELKQPDPR